MSSRIKNGHLVEGDICQNKIYEWTGDIKMLNLISVCSSVSEGRHCESNMELPQEVGDRAVGRFSSLCPLPPPYAAKGWAVSLAKR